ncbi:c-type cytochrome [Marinobacter salexigens]
MNGFERNKASWPFGLIQVLLMVILSPSALLADGQPEPSSSLSALENLVMQDCGSCHGMTLKGGLGPALRPENLSHLPEKAIAAIIREGIPGTAMPPWKPLLAPVDIEWISHQLKTGELVSP